MADIVAYVFLAVDVKVLQKVFLVIGNIILKENVRNYEIWPNIFLFVGPAHQALDAFKHRTKIVDADEGFDTGYYVKMLIYLGEGRFDISNHKFYVLSFLIALFGITYGHFTKVDTY